MNDCGYYITRSSFNSHEMIHRGDYKGFWNNHIRLSDANAIADKICLFPLQIAAAVTACGVQCSAQKRHRRSAIP